MSSCLETGGDRGGDISLICGGKTLVKSTLGQYLKYCREREIVSRGVVSSGVDGATDDMPARGEDS